MNWLRLYHDTVNDPKWRLVALDSGQPLSAVLAVWMSMMVCASQARDRGTLEGWDDRIAGAAIDLRGDQVSAIRSAMQGLVLDGDRLSGWDKRQRASDDAGGRQRKTRERREPKPPGGGGVGGNGHDAEHSATVARQTENVARHSGVVAENPLRAQTPESEEERKKGESCVSLESSAGARESGSANTHTVPPVFSENSRGVIPFGPLGGRRALPAGWVPSDAQLDLARSVGLREVGLSVLKFRDYWRTRGASKDAAGWCDAWEWWVREDARRESSCAGQSDAARDLLAGLRADGLLGGEFR